MKRVLKMGVDAKKKFKAIRAIAERKVNEDEAMEYLAREEDEILEHSAEGITMSEDVASAEVAIEEVGK